MTKIKIDFIASMLSPQIQLVITDGMRRPVSRRDAARSQVIDVLEAQEIRRPAMKKVLKPTVPFSSFHKNNSSFPFGSAAPMDWESISQKLSSQIIE